MLFYQLCEAPARERNRFFCNPSRARKRCCFLIFSLDMHSAVLAAHILKKTTEKKQRFVNTPCYIPQAGSTVCFFRLEFTYVLTFLVGRQKKLMDILPSNTTCTYRSYIRQKSGQHGCAQPSLRKYNSVELSSQANFQL